jgi:hypothetical protein
MANQRDRTQKEGQNMTYMTPFEKFQPQKKQEQEKFKVSCNDVIKPKLAWSDEIVKKIENQPRQPQESPLKIWWIEQQLIRDKNNGR